MLDIGQLENSYIYFARDTRVELANIYIEWGRIDDRDNRKGGMGDNLIT